MNQHRRSRRERQSRNLQLEVLEQRLALTGTGLDEQIADIYRLVLNREASPAAVNQHVAQLSQGTPLASVTRSLLNSPEFHQKLVTGFFRHYLDREPTVREVRRFSGLLNDGVSEEKVLARMFSTLPNSTNRQYVSFLYDKILGRQPDGSAMTRQLRILQAGGRRYASALTLLESPEFSRRIGTAIFRNVYGAQPTARELTGLTERLVRPEYGFSEAFTGAVSSERGQRSISRKSNNLMAVPPDGVESSQALFGIRATMYPGAVASTAAEVTKLVNQIRAVETFSNPTNPGQIVNGLRPDDFPNPDAVNDPSAKTTGTNGLDAYSTDGRNTPGAFQVDLANLNQVFGLWAGQAGSAKNSGPYDTQIAFSKSTLANFLGIQVDANGFITRVGKEAASVLLHSEAVALDDSFDPLHNSLIGLNIDNFQSEQLSLYLAARSPLDPTTEMASDTRVAPQAVTDMNAVLQGAAAKAFIWNSYNDYYVRPTSPLSATYLKAVGLFGSTMRVTASTSAFGVKSGETFLCQFNPGFIIGGGYVRGFSVNGVYDIIKAVVDADENGSATFTTTDAQGTLSLAIAQVAGSASGVTVSGNDVGYVGFAPDQTTETYRVTVVTPGGYGTAKLSVASYSGTDTPVGLVTPVAGVPIAIGSRGLTMTFSGGSFTAGASWTATVNQVSPTKTITVTESVEGGVKIFSFDRTPVNVSAQYPSLFHYGAIMSLYQVDMSNAGDWGVDQSPYDHGYTSHQVALDVQDTTTAPTGAGSYGITYSNLGGGKTLTLTGPDNYFVAPFVTHDPAAIVIKVDDSGYLNGGNNSQTVASGNRIDMSAFDTTLADAYPNFFYVYTASGADIVKHVSDASVPTGQALRMYYIPGAAGSVTTAQQAVLTGDFSPTSPFHESYRVFVANRSILGTPRSASDWTSHFIMSPPPPPPVGTGTVDASRATGRLFLKVDNSMAQVKLGSGSNCVVGSTINTPVTYVVNPAMADGPARTTFSGLRAGADKLFLGEFTNVANLQVAIGTSFDNKSNSPAIANFYRQYSGTATVSFESDVSGSMKTYTLQVLLSSAEARTDDQWKAMVNALIQVS